MNLTAEHVYTPSELNREVKLHLEMGFPALLLEAEISNLARPASGHLYFSLKDNRAQIRCAMFRSSATRVGIRVENGMKVLARGRISLYEPRGEYQFIVESLQDAGEGILQRQFEELKKKLESEGLFDPAHKKPIPSHPARIGLITSSSGAAVRDLLHVLQRRWPIAQVRLYPAAVQGTGAPAEIRQAIKSANDQRWADTLIIGRGGGSLEDLVAFNDEAVARSVFACDIPVISAVGHETDFSICDFVADLRAPTPSAAAELATPDQAVLKAAFSRSVRQLHHRMQSRLQQDTQRVDHAGHRLGQQHPANRLREQARQLEATRLALSRGITRKFTEQQTRLDTLNKRLSVGQPQRRLADLQIRVANAQKSLGRLIDHSLRLRREGLGNLVRTLHAVSPLETIGRGYSVITAVETGDIVSSTDQVKPDDRVSAQLKDGFLACTVNSIRKV